MAIKLGVANLIGIAILRFQRNSTSCLLSKNGTYDTTTCSLYKARVELYKAGVSLEIAGAEQDL